MNELQAHDFGKKTFKLKDDFVEKYSKIKPPFGFNGLGEFVYMRTYSRLKEDGQNEQWHETVRRVVEGTYSLQKNHIKFYGLGWNEYKAQVSANEMYDHIFNMRFLPPGRGLWAMGTSITEKGIFAALNNCAFVSTKDISTEPSKPFEFLMDMSMLGVGVGFDVKGAGTLTIKKPSSIGKTTFVISDTREGWVESVALCLNGYFRGGAIPTFDYSQVRPYGEPIKTFGGVACGPDPLEYLHKQISEVFEPMIGKKITSRNIVDIQNMIGCCVVAGNVRRTAEIVFGDPNDKEYLQLKNYNWNASEGKYEGPSAERAAYGWSSNNSIYAELGMDYSEVANQTARNGEPGYVWLENMREFSRMVDQRDNKDWKVEGSNPCVEQSLESFELCCLVETFPGRCDSLKEYKRVLKFAYLYAKTVTLGPTHWPQTNQVMLRNRRIGTSMSGIIQAKEKFGINEFKNFCEEGYETIQQYDEVYSDWLCVPRSIKTTSVKPSGTVSLLAGATPGMHWPENNFYIRRVRVAANSKLISKYRLAGYHIEEDVKDPKTLVISIPVSIQGVKTIDEVSIWEQFEMAAFMQKYWADNQVSCTVTFNPDLTEKEVAELQKLQDQVGFGWHSMDAFERYMYLFTKKQKSEAKEIKPALEYYQYQIKGISLLPKTEGGAFAQMPYEKISEEVYNQMVSVLTPVDLQNVGEESTPERFCDGQTCELVLPAAETEKVTILN